MLVKVCSYNVSESVQLQCAVTVC